MTVSARVLPSGHNNTKCETHWARWGKLTPIPDVHWYTKCTRGRRGAHIHSQTYCKHKCQLVTGILRPRYMDGVRPHRQQRSAMSRKENSQEKVISSQNPGRWDERAPTHTDTHTYGDRTDCCEDSSCNSSRLCAAAFYNWFKHTEAITLIPSIMCTGSSNSPFVLSYIYSLMACS